MPSPQKRYARYGLVITRASQNRHFPVGHMAVLSAIEHLQFGNDSVAFVPLQGYFRRQTSPGI